MFTFDIMHSLVLKQLERSDLIPYVEVLLAFLADSAKHRQLGELYTENGEESFGSFNLEWDVRQKHLGVMVKWLSNFGHIVYI